MPGEITDFVNQSKVPGVRIQTTMVGGNRIRIELIRLTAETQAMLDRICPNMTCAESVLEEALKIDLVFKITSTRSKIDLQSITTIVGIFFGSGLLLEVARRYARKKKAA
jgi:hypothetical protein